MAGAQDLILASRRLSEHLPHDAIENLLRRPVFIVSAPRAGSTLLFHELARVPGFWSIGGESHGIYRAFPHLRAENQDFDSGRLTAGHASGETAVLMRACFALLLRNHKGRPYLQLPVPRPASITLLEKTPRNSLNIPFLLRLFPEARFVFLHREARENIASIVEAWKLGLETGRFVTFRDLPGWDREAWCFLLPPGWRELVGKSLHEIAAFQWAATNDAIVSELQKLPRHQWHELSYAQLLDSPQEALNGVANFAGLASAQSGINVPEMAISATAITAPDPEKWRVHEEKINALYSTLRHTIGRIEELRSGDE